MQIKREFNIDKVICDIDVRYYVDCSFSKDNGVTWQDDFEDDDTTDAEVKAQLPCMKEITYKKYRIWTGKETIEKRVDWCPVIDVNEGKVLDWPEGFILKTHFKVCDQGVYVYSNYDETEQIVSTDCDEYYVPNWFNMKNGYGDYLIMTINGDGTIQDWDKLQKKLIEYVDDYLDPEKVKSHINIEEYVS